MRPLSHHIHTVRSKPHHIRKRVAFATAFGVAGLIGVVWAGASLASGAFAIKGSSFAEGSGESPVVAAAPSPANLAASPAEAGQTNTSAHIEIVDAKKSAPTAAQPTTIPF